MAAHDCWDLECLTAFLAGDHSEDVKPSNLLPPTDVDIEYVADAMIDRDDPQYDEWLKLFEHFNKPKEEAQPVVKDEDGLVDKIDAKPRDVKKVVDSDDEEEEEGGKEKLSRKKFKLLHRLSIAELKQLVKRPDVVEAWDVTASDPRLLVFLKSYRNSVPVPRHWCNKRKYLQVG